MPKLLQTAIVTFFVSDSFVSDIISEMEPIVFKLLADVWGQA